MELIKIRDLSFFNKCSFPLLKEDYESLDNFSHDFIFGNIYCLEGEIGSGAWGLSWVVSGYVTQKSGVIEIDNKEMSSKERRRISIRMGMTEKKPLFQKQSVYGLIRRGLKQSVLKENEVIEMFHLSPERLDRKIDQLSGERWRASMAVGLANSKKIFCFPWMNPEVVMMYKQLWFTETLHILKHHKALILIPIPDSNLLNGIADYTIKFSK